ncbi:sulfatase [Ammoniphilus sp. YIM 78166]|uniref:sulfatase n=1 Tax=Ammoniphilus sp. YIM 78166 TaxID=1644106 RepID=UPI00106F0D35|nr:sulfatase [Ammoniphilus sp. YIM 78166]
MKTIVILLDTLNRHMLEAYNNQTWVKTPNISRLAEKSVVFGNHWSGSLPCMPARRDIMTGRLGFLERGWGGLEPFDVTLTQKLREGNVFSHIVTDHYHYFATGGENYCQAFNTWDFYRGQETDPWISRVNPPGLTETTYGQTRSQYELNRKTFLEEEQYPGPKTIQAACRWLEENQEADRFFLMVEAFDPHEPFDCPQHYLDLYEDDYSGPRFDWPTYGRVSEPPEAMEHVRKRYAANLSMIDHWLGKLLDTMDQQQLWEDTMVIFTTDHGFLLGEHEWTGKNFMHVYNEIAHLPLMIHVPGMGSVGKQIDSITQNIDLMPTILEYFGIEIPVTVKGQSLLGLIDGTKEKLRDYALYGMHGMTVNLTDGEYTYLRAPAREDNHPCHVYTAMPTSFRSFHGVVDPGKIEVGRFLSQTDYPVFRIPTSQEGSPFKFSKNFRESLLFQLSTDYAQVNPVQDKELQVFYEKRLIEAMEREQAPAEQYVRLGLEDSPN